MQPIENEYDPMNKENDNANPPPIINDQQYTKPQEQQNLVPPQASPVPGAINPMNNTQPQLLYQQPAVQPMYAPVVGQPPLLSGNIVINQNQPFLPMQPLLVNPVQMICPFCKQNITTTVERQFNCCACCLCWLIGVFYFIIQAVRGKDLCCDDATHRCPQCNNVIGVYQCL